MNKNGDEKSVILNELIFENKEVVENKIFSSYYALKNK